MRQGGSVEGVIGPEPEGGVDSLSRSGDNNGLSRSKIKSVQAQPIHQQWPAHKRQPCFRKGEVGSGSGMSTLGRLAPGSIMTGAS